MYVCVFACVCVCMCVCLRVYVCVCACIGGVSFCEIARGLAPDTSATHACLAKQQCQKSMVAQLYSQHTEVFTVSLCFGACAAPTSCSCIIATIAHVLYSYFLFLIGTAMSWDLPLHPLTLFNVIR